MTWNFKEKVGKKQRWYFRIIFWKNNSFRIQYQGQTHWRAEAVAEDEHCCQPDVDCEDDEWGAQRRSHAEDSSLTIRTLKGESGKNLVIFSLELINKLLKKHILFCYQACIKIGQL